MVLSHRLVEFVSYYVTAVAECICRVCVCVCESYIGKPIGTRAVPQFTDVIIVVVLDI